MLVYITRSDDFSAEEKIIRKGLNDYAAEQVGIERTFLGTFCHDGDRFAGGVTAQITSSTLSIKLLWVHEDYRGQSIGSDLVQRLEEDARKKGCIVSFVDTLSYQAPEFYQKLGYVEAARIADFYKGHDRVFYRKDLA